MDPVKTLDVLTITKGTPQQYCPITMEDADGISYKEVFDVDPVTMQKIENFKILNTDDQHYIKLSRNDFDIKTLTVTLNEEPFEDFKIVNNLIIFNVNPKINDKIQVRYNILNSFYTEIDYEKDKTQMTIYSDYDSEIAKREESQTLKHKYKVYFETNKTNNKFVATNLSLNPIYRTDYKGFIYLTDEHNEPYTINIYRNPKYIKSGGYDKIDVSIECLDYEGNPVIAKDIDIDCDSGILNFDNTDAKHLTDINGVIHVLYESAIEPCIDVLTARTTTDNGKVIEASVEIINE